MYTKITPESQDLLLQILEDETDLRWAMGEKPTDYTPIHGYLEICDNVIVSYETPCGYEELTNLEFINRFKKSHWGVVGIPELIINHVAEEEVLMLDTDLEQDGYEMLFSEYEVKELLKSFDWEVEVERR